MIDYFCHSYKTENTISRCDDNSRSQERIACVKPFMFWISLKMCYESSCKSRNVNNQECKTVKALFAKINTPLLSATEMH